MTYRPKKPPWLHHVDEESKTVWLIIDSWMKAQAAPHMVKHWFGPDYKHKPASIDEIDELNKSA